MGFAENLQSLRKMKGMSQEQLAEKLDVSRQAVSKYESGNGYPETEKLIAICEIFAGTVSMIIYTILFFTDTVDVLLNGVVGGLCLGISFGMLIVGTIMTSRYASQIRAFKMRILNKK